MGAGLLQSYPFSWDLNRDEEGHREYTLQWRVQTTSALDGPDIALTAPGLPLPGAYLLIGNTYDPWAFYQRKGSAKLKSERDSFRLWDVTTVYSTKPSRRCQTYEFEDPLLEPPRLSGAFNKFMEEATVDKDNVPLTNSANQRLRGALVQLPKSRPTLELEMNVPWINLDFLSQYVESVNSVVWWGLPVRTIKCTDFTWTRLLFGACHFYFQVRFSFEIKRDTWDLAIPDAGTMKKVPGSSPPRYVTAKDDYEENVTMFLDGDGNPLPPGDDPVILTKRLLQEKDFSAVGWPPVLM